MGKNRRFLVISYTSDNCDASVKSTLPTRLWSVGVVFAAFFGLLAVASIVSKKAKNGSLGKE
jgi:hypothetical protein